MSFVSVIYIFYPYCFIHLKFSFRFRVLFIHMTWNTRNPVHCLQMYTISRVRLQV